MSAHPFRPVWPLLVCLAIAALWPASTIWTGWAAAAVGNRRAVVEIGPGWAGLTAGPIRTGQPGHARSQGRPPARDPHSPPDPNRPCRLGLHAGLFQPRRVPVLLPGVGHCRRCRRLGGRPDREPDPAARGSNRPLRPMRVRPAGHARPVPGMRSPGGGRRACGARMRFGSGTRLTVAIRSASPAGLLAAVTASKLAGSTGAGLHQPVGRGRPCDR